MTLHTAVSLCHIAIKVLMAWLLGMSQFPRCTESATLRGARCYKGRDNPAHRADGAEVGVPQLHQAIGGEMWVQGF